MKKILVFISLLLFTNQTILAWHSSSRVPGKIIYNATDEDKRIIAIGVNPRGHLNTSKEEDGGPNIVLNAGYTGVAYLFPVGGKKSRLRGGGTLSSGGNRWQDATAPGCQCEGWGAGGIDKFGRKFYGYANASSGISNVTVKSFTYDLTSIESVTTIKDSSGNPALEVKHIYGPSPISTDNLFEVTITITNIAGYKIDDVRYNRSMDWDIPPSEFNEVVSAKGVSASVATGKYPRVLMSGNNGFMRPNPFNSAGSHNRGKGTGDFERYGPRDHGFTATFGFGELLCGENHNFLSYYGAAKDRPTLEAALEAESIPLYSIGESNPTYSSPVSYAWGFKGVSGTALAPTLPSKTAIIPSGELTDETKIQTYASPVITDEHAYQAIFTYRNNHQWQGDILRYNLESDGSFTADAPTSARTKLEARLPSSLTALRATHTDYRKSSFTASAGTGRNIWTVGYDPSCPGSGSPFKRNDITVTKTDGTTQTAFDINNFLAPNGKDDNLDELLFNCAGEVSDGDTTNIVDFVRGWDAYSEDPVHARTGQNFRQSFIADTFHADLVFVGAPSAATSASGTYTEAYFRGANGYAAFKSAHKDREGRFYVGSNDGMLHAYDKELNHLWGFIPPSILPKLRRMEGPTGQSVTQWLVDGPIIVKDIFIKKTSEWKTLLIGGMGWGGKGYYVLDITDEYNPKHLFTFDNDYKNKQISYWSASGYKRTYDYEDAPDNMNYSKIGDTWARPSIMLMPLKDASDTTFKQRYTMVFGAGYAGGTDTNLGNYVYVLDFEPSPETFADPITGTTAPQFDGGNVIKIVTVTPDATSDIPNGVTAHMSVVTPDGAPVPVGKESLAYYGGIAYFPDLQGQVWKLDLSKTSLEEDDTTMYSINKMFSSEGTLANDRFGYNQMASTLVRSTDPEGTHLFQYYGTGDQAHIQTRYPSIKNRLYGVKDLDWPDTGLTLTGSSKTIASSGILNIDSGSCDITNVPGWYTHVKNQATLDDPPLGDGADNMKVIGRAIVANKDVYFTIYRPEDKECPAYGSGETIKLKEGCGGGVETIAIGAGLTTAPVMDNKGNIYVGVSNLATGETLEGKGEEGDLEGFSGRDNILKIGSSDVSESSSEPGIKIKSWREITGEY